MAIERELFSILQTGASGPGSSPTKKAEGDAVASAVEMPVLASKDLAGNFQHIPIRASGNAAPALNVPVLPAKDGSGNLQYLEVDAFGNLNVNADPGVPDSESDEALATVGAYVDVVTLTLVASSGYKRCNMHVASSQITQWELIQIDDATETVIAKTVTGPGDFGHDLGSLDISITAGATGTQELVVRGKQIHGQASDLLGTVSAVKAN